MQKIAAIGAMNRPQFRNMPTLDLAGAIDNYYTAKDNANAKAQRQAYVEQLTNENPQDAAKIAYDPAGYAKVLQDNANAERDQKFKMDVLGKQFDNALALENKRNANAIGLAKLASQLKNNQTTGMQIFTNDAMEKGFNKADENMGKNYAEDLESYRSMTSKLPELEATVDKLSQLAQNATYTKAGQVLDLTRKELGVTPRQSAIDRKEYISIVDNQILPLLRDTFGAQFTEREGNTLKQTLGDVNATPEEKDAVLRSFINQKKKSVESQIRKLQSYSNGLSTNGTQNLMLNYKDKYGLE